MPRIPDCDRCYFRAYNEPLVCAVHPAGPDGDSCLDFRLDPQAYVHLLIVEDDGRRLEFLLECTHYLIGRDPHCDIHLYSRFVSRHHATLLQQQHEDGTIYYKIIDGSLEGKRSRNGLLINGCKIESQDLRSGDAIIFGYEARGVYQQVLRAYYLYGYDTDLPPLS